MPPTTFNGAVSATFTLHAATAGHGAAVLVVESAAGLVPGAFVERRRLAETNSAGRFRFNAAGDSEAVTVKITQEGPSAQTSVFAVELDVRPYDTDSETS